MSSPFVHLHVHSHYSLLSALPQIKDMVKLAVKLEMPALALTDNGNLYGAIEFYKACTKANIKPIIGVDFYIAHRTRNDKESGIDSRRTRIILLAKDYDGYQNLIKLVTYSNLEGFYYKPRVDKELLEKYSQGLIAIVPAFNSEIRNPLQTGHEDEALTVIERYKSWYGADNLYLELTHHPEVENHSDLMKKTREFARKNNLQLVASNDVHYLNPDEQPARRTLLLIQSGAGPRQSGDNEADFSFKTGEEMAKLFKDDPDAIANTLAIADKCNLTIEIGKWMFPALEVPEGSSYGDELTKWVWRKVEERKYPIDEVAKTRIEFELNTIISKGYAPYFLVMGDLLRYAHENGIYTNTRGSVGGSLVSYLLGITIVDPLEYNLPFERFLNPFRPSPPDIDLDIADNRRDEMIAYARQKYGEKNVAQIGTFGTMLARGSVRDTARAMGYEYGVADTIAKLIPFGSQGFPMTIERALEEEPDLKKAYNQDEDTKRIIDMARKVEGCARHISVHAAGVVMSPIPLDTIVPVQWDPKGEGKLITQYDMHCVEDVGLLKFDFLGLKNLAILADAVKRVKKIYDIDVDVGTVPVDDPKTFEMLAKGFTMATFQLAGSGMTAALKELRPSSIHDINLMVALYRPGPMDNIKEYVARKRGDKPTIYAHPKMQSFLEPTFGVLVYQDDLLMTAIEVAGYTWEEVDKFRKAVGKKIPEEMAKQHIIFVEGCIKHSGMTEAKAQELWKLFEPFQGYGFNKAHAASYGRLAYETAYMKANYPTAYMAAVLTADSGNLDSIAETMAECKRMHIDVLPPDVNESLTDFSVVTKKLSGDLSTEALAKVDDTERIRFGLYSIKNFGEGIGDSIIAERKANGPFISLEDFLSRIKDKNLNKKSLESLIKAGALDAFGERGSMLANLVDLLAHHKHAALQSSDQSSLFGATPFATAPLKLKEATPATREEKLAWEKDLLGLYISGHPLDQYKAIIEQTKVTSQNLASLPPGMTAVLYGHVDEVKIIPTKKGDKMAFIRLSDYHGSIEVVAFPKLFEEIKHILIPNTCVGIKGKLSARKGEMSIIADKIKPLAPQAPTE